MEAGEHIADHRAGRGCDDADDFRQERTRLLARLLEKTFGGELALSFVEQRHQRAGARWIECLDDDLIFRRPRKRRDAALDDDFHALLGLETQPPEGALPDHRIDLGLVVLESEIAMAGRVRSAIARDFAAQADVAEAVFERALDGARKLGHRKFRGVGTRPVVTCLVG